MALRSASWMDEVGTTRPRRPSANGPLLPYQIASSGSKPQSYRAHSFSGEQLANHRGFAPHFGPSATTPILEDGVFEGSDGGSDFSPNPYNRRMSTPLTSPNQTSYVGNQKGLWTGSARSPLTPQSGFFDFEGPLVPSTPMSPTGVTHMRKLTAELANIAGPFARDAGPMQDPRECSSKLAFTRSPTFPETYFIAQQIKPISEEAFTWDAVTGQRSSSDWESTPKPTKTTYPLAPTGLGPFAHELDTLRFAIVGFKNNRADVFYFHTVQGMVITEGSVVVVDADRGQDLGTVLMTIDSPITAHDLKKKLNKEHYEALLRLSRIARPPGWSTEASFNTYHDFNTTCAFAGGFPIGDLTSTVRKRIKRHAYDREIQLLEQRRELEERAKRLCILAVQRHGLHLHEMEILDAEFQHDFNKLTFYFLSPQYLHFNPLVTELFKLFKTRIWMSALNPASCVAPSPMTQMARGPAPWYDARAGPVMTPRLRNSYSEYPSGSNFDLRV